MLEKKNNLVNIYSPPIEGPNKEIHISRDKVICVLYQYQQCFSVEGKHIKHVYS